MKILNLYSGIGGNRKDWGNKHKIVAVENNLEICDMKGTDILYGFDLKDKNVENKRKLLRNMVNPKLGKHILECALGTNKQKQLL